MNNTETSVGESTSTRIAIVYKATHPSVEGIYIGCKLDSLDGYYTSSDCFDEAIETTGIKPTLESIDMLEMNWDVEEDRQIPYKREQEVYDFLQEMGATLLNRKRPSGYNHRATKANSTHQSNRLLGNTHGRGNKGKPATKEKREAMTGNSFNKPALRKVISMLDGRVTIHAQTTRWNEKNPDYIGTWIDL